MALFCHECVYTHTCTNQEKRREGKQIMSYAYSQGQIGFKEKTWGVVKNLQVFTITFL